MKTKMIVALALSAVGLAAADLKLSDGRTFQDYRIVNQTPSRVTIRYKGGGAIVEKKLLPADVLAQFPIDEAKLEVEAADIEKGRAIYEAQKRATKQKEADAIAAKKAEVEEEAAIAKQRAKTRKQLALEAAEARKAAAEEKKRIFDESIEGRVQEAVREEAKQWFREQKTSGVPSAYQLKPDIFLRDAEQVQGWTGRWEVVGWISGQFYDSRGMSFGNFPRSWFRATVQVNNHGTPEVSLIEGIPNQPR